MHGIAPQPAVNALLLWTLANNTFVMNEKTKDSLKAKTMAMTPTSNSIQPPPPTTQLPVVTAAQLPFPPADLLPITSSTAAGSQAVTSLMASKLPQPPPPPQPAAAAPLQQAVMAAAAAGNRGIPSFLQALLNNNPAVAESMNSSIAGAVPPPPPPPLMSPGTNASAPGAAVAGSFHTKLTIENIVAKLTRSHVGPNAKESFQCLVCSKWFAVPPIKHMRGHIIAAREEKRKSLPLMEGNA